MSWYQLFTLAHLKPPPHINLIVLNAEGEICVLRGFVPVVSFSHLLLIPPPPLLLTLPLLLLLWHYPCLLAIPAVDRIAGRYNRHLNRGIC